MTSVALYKQLNDMERRLLSLQITGNTIRPSPLPFVASLALRASFCRLPDTEDFPMP